MKYRLWKLASDVAQIIHKAAEIPFVLTWEAYCYCENKASPRQMMVMIREPSEDKSKLN